MRNERRHSQLLLDCSQLRAARDHLQTFLSGTHLEKIWRNHFTSISQLHEEQNLGDASLWACSRRL